MSHVICSIFSNSGSEYGLHSVSSCCLSPTKTPEQQSQEPGTTEQLLSNAEWGLLARNFSVVDDKMLSPGTSIAVQCEVKKHWSEGRERNGVCM